MNVIDDQSHHSRQPDNPPSADFEYRHIVAAWAHRHTLANDLRLALERGELMLHYPPQIAADSGKLSG